MNFKIIGCFMISAAFAFANDINGIYLLPKILKIDKVWYRFLAK